MLVYICGKSIDTMMKRDTLYTINKWNKPIAGTPRVYRSFDQGGLENSDGLGYLLYGTPYGDTYAGLGSRHIVPTDSSMVDNSLVNPMLTRALNTSGLSGSVKKPNTGFFDTKTGKTIKDSCRAESDGWWGLHCFKPGTYSVEISCDGYYTERYEIGYISGEHWLDTLYLVRKDMALSEVKITAKRQLITSDRRVAYPSAHQKERCSDGATLLGMMQFPNIDVVRGKREVNYWGSGELMFYINDTEATIEQVIAIPPKDVLRIEYIDKPPYEYTRGADVGVVIRYITKKYERGVFNRWLVVDKANYNTTQFPTFEVLKCDKVFQWIMDDYKIQCAGVLRSQNSYNSGIWSDNVTTITEDQYKEIDAVLQTDPKEIGYKNWDGPTLSTYISRKYNVNMSVRQCQRLFHSLGYSHIRPQPYPSKGYEDSEARNEFKKNVPN